MISGHVFAGVQEASWPPGPAGCPDTLAEDVPGGWPGPQAAMNLACVPLPAPGGPMMNNLI